MYVWLKGNLDFWLGKASVKVHKVPQLLIKNFRAFVFHLKNLTRKLKHSYKMNLEIVYYVNEMDFDHEFVSLFFTASICSLCRALCHKDLLATALRAYTIAELGSEWLATLVAWLNQAALNKMKCLCLYTAGAGLRWFYIFCDIID